MNTAEALAQFESQGVLQPGEPGWWKVWGACPRHVQAGDLISYMNDGEVSSSLIEETFTAKAAPMRIGLSSDGERFTLGAMVRIVVLRRGTKNTLVP